MYHPYSHSLSALTEYLKQKLRSQCAKCLSHSLPAQVKQDIPLERNINSDFTLAATTLEYLDQRGECNIPKRYLKEADWCEDGTLGAGYYIANPDEPTILILVNCNFKHLQWGCTHPKKDKFMVERPAPVRYGLCIFDEERTQDRSCWGPLDGTPDEDEHLTQNSNSEAKLEETPQTLTLSSPNLRKKRSILSRMPNSSWHTLANHPSNLDHWLVQWHELHQQQPSLTAWWPEPWELEYPKEETPLVPKESSEPFSPHNMIEEMEVEMILLNLTDEMLKNPRKEGQEVVEVEMTPETAMEEVAEEADLIQQAAAETLIQECFLTRWSEKNQKSSLEIKIRWKNSWPVGASITESTNRPG